MQPEKPDSPDAPDWLISYGDLMSLLLCLFILLYAISAVQETKMQSATASLRSGFGLFGTNQQTQIVAIPRPEGRRIGQAILFDFGSDDLSDEAKRDLDTVYWQLLDVLPNTEDTILIIGQVQSGESSAYRRDLDLAYARSVSVWDYLVSLGVDRQRLQVVQQTGVSAGSLVEIRNVR
ncbi:MAG: OmpA family protein [Planctomycetaceae bacterium]|nr:OmpA family protein [Planctomycetaceae bacterium]